MEANFVDIGNGLKYPYEISLKDGQEDFFNACFPDEDGIVYFDGANDDGDFVWRNSSGFVKILSYFFDSSGGNESIKSRQYFKGVSMLDIYVKWAIKNKHNI